MGLLQYAILTYDVIDSIGLVGEYVEGKEPLAPIGHLITTAKIEITVGIDGEYISADSVDKKIIIPVSEESAGRTSAPAPHPICDNIGYVSGLDPDKGKLFLDQLKRWENSAYGDEKITAIRKYVEAGHVMEDLDRAGLLKKDDKGKIKNEKDMICWSVKGLGERDGGVYSDKVLFDKYQNYYLAERQMNSNKSVCFLSGKNESIATQHLKGVVSLNGNAKIISANDSSNFTYRGRFIESDEALTVGYTSSQKAHNALKWLVATQGYISGGRTFICWNPRGIKIPSVSATFLKKKKEERVLPSDYKKELKSLIAGYRTELGDTDDVIIASFDAATTGRLSVSYYNELKGSDFLDRLVYWEESCSWFDERYGVYSPSLFEIIRCAFGYQRGNDESARLELDDKLVAMYYQRLIECKVDKRRVPMDILRGLVNRCGNMQIYNRNNRDNLLFTTCAMIRKNRMDRREECEMSLDVKKKDRSYQYGRLLAVLEKVEKDTYGKGEERETNAIRMQAGYVKRPAYAAKIILEQLNNSYFPRLRRDRPGVAVKYDKLIGEIFEVLSEFEDELNKPLEESYLLGYYLQKNELYKKKETEVN